MSPCKGRNGALQEFLDKVMGKGKEKAYIKGFLVEALINAMPLKEPTAVVERVLLSICWELDSSGMKKDEYDIKVAFAESLLELLPSEK